MILDKKDLAVLERSSYIIVMNTLSTEKRCQVIAALLEEDSIRATVRMTGVAKGTVLKLLVDLGLACEEYQRRTLVSQTGSTVGAARGILKPFQGKFLPSRV